VLLSDSSCFADLMPGNPKPKLTSTYSYEICDTLDMSTGDCIEFSYVLESLSIYPPFLYNNQCRNALLNAFVPVFIYSYSYSTFISPLLYFALSQVKPSSRLPHYIRALYPSILWPTEPFNEKYPYVFDLDECFCSQLMHIAVMITFGITSPPLLAIITVAVYVEYVYWRVIIGRYFLLSTEKDVSFDIHLRSACYD
jgi:hypothetical protein